MDSLEVFTGVLAVLRIAVVSLVLAFNILSLKKSRKTKCTCINGLLSDSTKICSVMYIMTWLPYLLNSLLSGSFSMLNSTTFCLLQNYMTNAISVVLLAFAAILSVHAFRREISKKLTSNSKVAAGVVLAAWFFPQAIYFLTITQFDGKLAGDFKFVGKYFNSSESSALPEGLSVKIGFTICGIQYSPLARSQYFLTYMLLVASLGGIAVFGCFLRYALKLVRRLRKNEEDKEQLLVLENCCSCPDRCHKLSPCLGPVLGVHVLWQLLLKPVVLAYWWYYLNNQDGVYIDVGTHMVIAAVAIFTPVSKLTNQRPVKTVYSIESDI